MKKYFIILVLLIMNILLYLNKNRLYMASFIDFNLQDDELALTLLSLENSKSVLINKSDLLMLEYIDSNKIHSSLNLYGIDVLNNAIFIDQSAVDIKSYNKQTLKNNLNIGNINLMKTNNIISINYYNYSFCIYKTGNEKDISNCDFIYFLDLDNIDFTDDVLAVFFDSNIDKEKIEKYYDKWVDSYILKENSFYTLKMSQSDYEVIEVATN